MERLLRWIWSSYPSGFRARYGRELLDDLNRRKRRGGRVGVAMVVDATWTLLRLWGRHIAHQAAPEAVMADVRVALRTLRRSPGYAAVVVSILAVALGGNVGVFNVTYAVLLDALPYEDPEQVFAIDPAPLVSDESGWRVDPSFADLTPVRDAALYIGGGGANLTLSGQAERVSVAQATDRFFEVLGVRPLLGRTLDGTRGESVVALSYDFWRRALGGDADVVGITIALNGHAVQVLGVMPEGVGYPGAVDVWMPFPASLDLYSGAIGPSAIVRSAEGVGSQTLRQVVEERVARAYVDRDAPAPPVRVRALREDLAGSARVPLAILMAISGLVVLLGCLNLAGLVLARSAARRDEASLRRALGASRWRIFRQRMAEVTVLAVLAGSGSLMTCTLSTELLRAVLPAGTPGLADAGLSGVSLVFTAALTCVAAVLVGILPASLEATARERPGSSRPTTPGRDAVRSQGALVAAQVALAFVLVTGAALTGRSLAELEEVPMGYDLDVLTFQVRLPESSYPEGDARAGYVQAMESELAAIPGVVAAGATTFLPQQGGMGVGFRVRNPDAGDGAAGVASWVRVTPGYFEAMGIRAVEGRPFDGSSGDRWSEVALSRSLARTLSHSRVGAEVEVGAGSDWRSSTVVAVIEDVRIRSQRSSASDIVYAPMGGSPPGYLGFAVRSERDSESLADRVREVASAVDPSVPPFALSTTREAAAERISAERAVAWLSRIFSGAALLLAALGLYGLVAQQFERRRRELGIRLVLGERPRSLIRRSVLRALVVASLGLIVGLAASAAMAGYLSALLFGISPHDPATFVGVVLVTLSVATLAAYVPARRCGRLDPARSLRPD